MRWTIVVCTLLVGCGGQVDQPSETSDATSVDTAADGTDTGTTTIDDSSESSVIDWPPCPGLVPKSGGECPLLDQSCGYETSCGGTVEAKCTSAGWSLMTGISCECPPSPRGFTVACEAAMKCEYDGPCGKITSECAGPGSHWNTSIGSCMDGGSCPATEPAVGETCLGGGKCSYDTKCGNETVYCNSSGYTLGIDYAHCPGCPEAEPTEGASCGSGVSCWYASPCGKRNEANCTGGKWTLTRPDCSK